ncbi:MAG: threonine/serine dehydratase [Acidobacteriota bacterium]
MTPLDVGHEALEAEQRIRALIRETPLEYSPLLSRRGGCEVYLKLENLQITGSFKLRGAMNSLLSLQAEARGRGVVTASSGNHGVAVAHAMKTLGCEGTIYLPENASPAKVRDLRSYGVDLRFWGNDCVEAEKVARQTAEQQQKVFISPYNDPKVIGGQGTIGIELERQLGDIDAALVPVGGGGLISGIAGYLKSVDESIEIVGCQPQRSAAMYESIKAGRIVDIPSLPTLSNGTAGGIEPGSITLKVCQACVDDFVLIGEEEIKAAIRLMLEEHHLLIEGAAALAVATFLELGDRLEHKKVVLIISGSRISVEDLKEVIR